MQVEVNNNLKISDVCAIIVSYFPDTGFKERLYKILCQVDRIVIINNGSNISLTEILGELVGNKKIKLIQNPQNLGIAKALNQGIALAFEEGYRWAWSFDHDTSVPQGVLGKLISCYNEIVINQKIGLVAPNFYDINSGYYCLDLNKQGSYFEVVSAINSGSLIRLDIFYELGAFNEKFFIDCVDDEYCLRMYEKNYKAILVKNAVIHHKVGFATNHKLFHKSLVTKNHSPLRRYYWSRNGFSLIIKYIFHKPLLALGILKSHLITIFITLLFEKQKLKKLRYLILGAFDAIINKFDRKVSIAEMD